MKIPYLHRGPDAAIIRRLVERFLDGDTTPAQEKIIYGYYASNSALPGDLEQYRPMFGWYASMAPASRRRPRRKIAGMAAAIAVLVAVAAGVAFNYSTADDRLYASYQGSYIIRNGQRIDDIRLIYDNLSSAEHMADSLIDLADRQAEDIEQASENIMLGTGFSGIFDTGTTDRINKEMFE